ncbi:DUF1203 domain-containing protein [Nioella sp. MMSF_3534]|uniref:DUF1203 domain-containing protein n=1 Tax=Nioella sp. MMSF_3534 TaxID=3046720 RepID=UPI003532350F
MRSAWLLRSDRVGNAPLISRDRGEGSISGTGRATDCDHVQERTAQLLSRGDVAYVDVRSAPNNCFQTRIAAAP